MPTAEPKAPPMEPEGLTVEQAATFLQVDTRTIFAMVDDGRLPAANITKKRRSRRRNLRIARSALEALLATRQAKTKRG